MGLLFTVTYSCTLLTQTFFFNIFFFYHYEVKECFYPLFHQVQWRTLLFTNPQGTKQNPASQKQRSCSALLSVKESFNYNSRGDFCNAVRAIYPRNKVSTTQMNVFSPDENILQRSFLNDSN